MISMTENQRLRALVFSLGDKLLTVSMHLSRIAEKKTMNGFPTPLERDRNFYMTRIGRCADECGVIEWWLHQSRADHGDPIFAVAASLVEDARQLLTAAQDAVRAVVVTPAPLTGYGQPIPRADYREGDAGELTRGIARFFGKMSTIGEALGKIQPADLAASLSRSIAAHSAGVNEDDATGEFPQTEIDAATKAEEIRRAESKAITDEVAAGIADEFAVAPGTPHEHQPVPRKSQDEKEFDEARAHYYRTLARRAKAAKASQSGRPTEMGGEG